MATSSFKKYLAKIPFLFTLFFTGFISYNFNTRYLIHKEGFQYALMLSLHIFTVMMMVWSLCKVQFTSPGYVKDSIQCTLQHRDEETQVSEYLVKEVSRDLQQPLLNEYIVRVKTKVEKKRGLASFDSPEDLMLFRYCNKCESVKPPRAHHCSVCGECITKMDHHCPWIGTCVGLHNQKYFLNFLLYVNIATSIITYSLLTNRINETETFYDMFQRYQKDQPLVITLLLSLVFTFFTYVLIVTHGYFLLKNSSSIEMEPLSFENPFNMGFRNNFRQIMGDDWKRWLLPVEARFIHERRLNGIVYPTSRNPGGEFGVPVQRV